MTVAALKEHDRKLGKVRHCDPVPGQGTVAAPRERQHHLHSVLVSVEGGGKVRDVS